MHRLLVMVLSSGLVSAQTVERTFLLRTPATQREFNDLAAVVVAVSAAREADRNSETRELKLAGTATQLEAAEWTLSELDRPPAAEPPVAKRHALERSDVLGLFHLDATSEQGFNEIQTAIRTLTDVRYLGPLASKRALVLRGTPEQLDFSAWLLTKPGSQTGTYTYPRMPERREYPDNIARVIRYPREVDIQTFNSFQTLVRTISDARRVYPFIEQRTIFMRGSTEEGEIALWLTAQFNRSLPAEAKSMSPVYTMSTGELIRIFHFDSAIALDTFRERATAIRTATGIRRFYPFESARTIAARGSAAQMAQLEALFQQ